MRIKFYDSIGLTNLSDEQIQKMIKKERRSKIIEVLMQEKNQTHHIRNQLQEKYGISVALPTIQKDMQALSDSGLVIHEKSRFQLAGLRGEAFNMRCSSSLQEKEDIGRYIAKKHIDPDRVVVLGPGSTMISVAKCIIDFHYGPLTFETPNIEAALTLIRNPRAPYVKLWGGQIDTAVGATVIDEQGAIDLVGKQLGKIVLISLSGISPSGDFFTYNNLLSPMLRGLLRSDTLKTIIALDSSRIGKGGIVLVAKFEEELMKYIQDEKRSYIIVTNSKPEKGTESKTQESFKKTLNKLEGVHGIRIEYVD